MAFNHDSYQVAWVCCQPFELAAAKIMLDEEHPQLSNKEDDLNLYTYGRSGTHNVVIACLPHGRTGTTPASRVANDLRYSHQNIQIQLLVGTGGGAPSELNDVRLGDVVISSPGGRHGAVLQYDYGKAIGEGIFTVRGHSNKPPTLMLSAVSSLRATHMIESPAFCTYIQNACQRHPQFASPGPEHDLLFDAEYDHAAKGQACRSSCDKSRTVYRPPAEANQSTAHYGLIASSNGVMRDGAKRQRLQEEYGVLCFEMEAAGVMDDFPCLVIRGICNYADSHKNDQWRDYAALAAAAYAKDLLETIPMTSGSSNVETYQSRALLQPSSETWQTRIRGTDSQRQPGIH